MAIIALKAWYLAQYEPIRDIIKRPHDLRLSRNSLLKSGLRADFLDDSDAVESSVWFQRYLEGESVEFYIEGSGGYTIANIDLISQEIYFNKQETTAILDPVIYLSSQRDYTPSSDAIRSVLAETIETLNQRSRHPLQFMEGDRPLNTPVRLTESQLRKIRKSLLVIADVTAIARIQAQETSQLVLSSPVCAELGYALSCKRAGQILGIEMERADLKGKFPFDFPNYQELVFKTPTELQQTLPKLVESLLQRFSLW